MICTRLIFCLAQQQHAVLRENYEKETAMSTGLLQTNMEESPSLQMALQHSAGLPFNKIGIWYIS